MSSPMEARILLSKVTNDDQSEVCLIYGKDALTCARFEGLDWDLDLFDGLSSLLRTFMLLVMSI